MTEHWASCPYCGKPCVTAGDLADHINAEHREGA
jgi:hypothetical protein